MTKRSWVAAILLGLVVVSCATEQAARYMREGQRYGVTRGVFRGRWWNYYERGTSFLAGKFYAEAERDFLQALRGRAKDTWRARTYGLHFVEYFPKRELGITYFYMDRLDEAERWLNDSLADIDTERAHFFLDEIKRKKIAQGTLRDERAPEIGIVAERGAILSETELPLELDVKDDVGVTEVKVNAEPVPMRGSKPEVKVKRTVALKEGPQKVTVQTKDLAEKTTEQTVDVTVDLTGPTIGIFSPIEPTVTPNPSIGVDGATVDKNGVVSVHVADRLLAEGRGEKRLPFRGDLPLGEGENVFVVAARDVAGNETRTAIKVFRGDPKSRAAKLWLLKQKAPQKLMLAQAGDVDLDLLLAQADTEAAQAEIRLKSPDPGRPYRNSKALRISGEVITPTGVSQILINGEPFTDLTGAPKESFNKRIPLDPQAVTAQGEIRMPVSIEAEDRSGLKVAKNVEVAVRPVTLDSLESKMPVAVLAYTSPAEGTELPSLLRLESEAALLHQGRFRVLDRTRLQDVLTEQQLSAALSDPNQALTLGRLTPAHVFLVGDVFVRGENAAELKARVINTETSDVVATLDAFIADTRDTDAVRQSCVKLAQQLADIFPRLSGEVVAVRGNELLLSWTREEGLREGQYVLLVKEEEPWKDPNTGEVLAPGDIVELGRAQVRAVLPNGTRAVTVQKKVEDITFETGMPAVTM
jgi:hypothetical protein